MPTYAVTFKEGSKTRTASVDTFSERDAVDSMLKQGRQVLKISELPPEPMVSEKPRPAETSGLRVLGFILLFCAAIVTTAGVLVPNLFAVVIGCSLAVSAWVLIAAAAIGKEINLSMRR